MEDFNEIRNVLMGFITVGAGLGYFRNITRIMTDRENTKKYMKRILHLTAFLAISVTLIELLGIGQKYMGL